MKTIGYLLFALLPFAASAASYPVDIDQQLNGAEVTVTPQVIDRDLAGPQEENMADMIRRYLRVIGDRARVQEVPIPGAMGKVSASGALLAGPDVRLGVQTFEEWLSSPDVHSA